MQKVSASVEQMGATINQNSENAKVTDAMATQAEASHSGRRGGERNCQCQCDEVNFGQDRRH